MDNVSFHSATEESLPELAGILNYYIEHTTVSFHTQKLTATAMKEKVFFDDPRFKTFLVRQDEAIIGYCAVSPWKKQEAYAHTGEINIYLAPGSTGKGIGSTAIAYLTDHARANDIRNLIAGLCSENYPSRRLFEQSGFVLCARFRNVGLKFGRLLDTIYLQKMLQETPSSV